MKCTALKNAGIEGPYILLPHSICGAYATYRASKYPEETEGVVFLDGTWLDGKCDLSEGDVFVNRLVVVASKPGLVRLVKDALSEDVISGMNYSDEQRKYSEALNLIRIIMRSPTKKNIQTKYALLHIM